MIFAWIKGGMVWCFVVFGVDFLCVGMGEGGFGWRYGLFSASEVAFAGRFSGNNGLGMRVVEIKTGTNRMSVPAFPT